MKPFKEEMLTLVHRHGAINNEFLRKFSEGNITPEEFRRFAVEYYHFSRHFPLVLCSLLINTKDEQEAAELTKILTSELGDGNPEQRHELMYRRFLRSIDLEPCDVLNQPMLATTKQWIDAQLVLYSQQNHFLGLGASFGLENMAITMWDQLISGLKIIKERWFPAMNMGYFTFHRELEEQHEDAMDKALSLHEDNEQARTSIRQGAQTVLDAEEGFWLGLAEL